MALKYRVSNPQLWTRPGTPPRANGVLQLAEQLLVKKSSVLGRQRKPGAVNAASLITYFLSTPFLHRVPGASTIFIPRDENASFARVA